jgi:CheY-like chemotaxis protein
MLLKKIVIAEDDDAIAHMLNMALGDGGYLCVRARAGDEALRMVRMHTPDLLILDVMMPVVDGLEVARRLRADVILSATPILMLTALGGVDQKVRAWTPAPTTTWSSPSTCASWRAVRADRAAAAARHNPTTRAGAAFEAHRRGAQGRRAGGGAARVRTRPLGQSGRLRARRAAGSRARRYARDHPRPGEAPSTTSTAPTSWWSTSRPRPRRQALAGFIRRFDQRKAGWVDGDARCAWQWRCRPPRAPQPPRSCRAAGRGMRTAKQG